jgi:hypothetical protein
VLFWYRVWETKGNCKVSVVMCAGLVQGVGDEGNWNVFSGDLCLFGTRSGRRREIEMFQW